MNMANTTPLLWEAAYVYHMRAERHENITQYRVGVTSSL
jgi:hypothetical protein